MYVIFGLFILIAVIYIFSNRKDVYTEEIEIRFTRFFYYKAKNKEKRPEAPTKASKRTSKNPRR